MKSIEPLRLRAPHETLGALDADSAARVVEAAGDISLVVGDEGQIVDISFAAGDPTGAGADKWLGRDWAETVGSDSKGKVSEMIAAARAGVDGRWRQVNHPTESGDVPVRYFAVGAHDGRIVVIGRDMRAMAAMQQRLIQTQQSLERDYLRLRQAESRYKLLFDLGSEPVLVVDAETRRIKEANPAALALAKAKGGALVNRPLTALIDAADHDAAVAYLGSVSSSSEVPAATVRLAVGTKGKVTLSATAFRQDRTPFFLVRLSVHDALGGSGPGSSQMLDVIEHLPDGFVLVDASLRIITANQAFLEQAQAAMLTRVKGATLGRYLGRAGIDMDLIVDQLREHGSVRNVATIMRGSDGAIDPVEVSAVAAPGPEGDCFGFSIRSVGRRMTDLPPTERDLPRSVEQLTGLVGRMSLKEIVRESTDLIERLCIEAALEYTADNRASAAEILGVSRQSLYSKLHRHGLGNLVPEEE
jgi:transcriptional regulator PpsR